ncbi:MAG: bifunctional ADP-heptose synthase, partial [Candidatus Omnitrophica bacterium]|nr:bifunctional ADP-heptose synthase [Candidatus Omnitrophota bacterium]
RISPEAPVPVVEVTEEHSLLGGAGNVAANISSLGAGSVIIGVMGKDEPGQKLAELISASKVRNACFLREQPTTTKIRIVARTQQLLRIDREKKIPFHLSPSLGKTLRQAIGSSQAVVISDYGKGFITKRLIDELRRYCRQTGKFLTVDPKIEHFTYYRRVSCLTPNRSEAAAGMHEREPDNFSELIRLGERIIRKLDSQNLLVTLGREGMLLFISQRQVWHIPAAALEVYDVTGAGDTVIAVLTLALAAGANILEASIIANLAAGIVVGRFGTASVTVKELDEFYSVHCQRLAVEQLK